LKMPTKAKQRTRIKLTRGGAATPSSGSADGSKMTGLS
jgi:hypothetical protein